MSVKSLKSYFLPISQNVFQLSKAKIFQIYSKILTTLWTLQYSWNHALLIRNLNFQTISVTLKSLITFIRGIKYFQHIWRRKRRNEHRLSKAICQVWMLHLTLLKCFWALAVQMQKFAIVWLFLKENYSYRIFNLLLNRSLSKSGCSACQTYTLSKEIRE